MFAVAERAEMKNLKTKLLDSRASKLKVLESVMKSWTLITHPFFFDVFTLFISAAN